MTNIDFIILDGKCFVDEGQTAVDFDFVAEALLALGELYRITGKHIQHCLNTGYVERLERHKQRMPVFEKVTEQDELFKHIIRVVSENDDYQIQKKFQPIFDMIDGGLLPKPYKNELVTLIREMESENPKEYKTALRRIRPLIEAAYKELRKCKGILKDELFPNEKPSVSAISKFLAGNQTYSSQHKKMVPNGPFYMPLHIYYIVDNLQKVISESAMHDQDEMITSNLLKSCFYGMIEFLMWYKNFYLKNR